MLRTPELTQAPEQATSRFFYGWVIVGFTFVAQFIAMGTVFYTFGVLLKPLTAALGADRFLVSLALSIQTVLIALVGPWVGQLIAERSIRALMLGGSALMSLGFLAMSQSQALWHLYLSFGVVLAAGMALAGPLPNNTLLANWFVRRRGTAFGISQFGITISGTAMVPLTTWLVLEFGWRSTVALFAIAPLAVLAPLIWWLVVDRPEARGLSPDGDTPAAPSSDAYAYKPLKMGAALRDRRIWLLTLTVGPSFMTIGAVIQAMHSHITDMGMSGMQASSVLVLMTFMGAVAKPLFGILADHSNPRAAMALSLALQGTGLGLIVQLQSHGGLMLAGFLFGLGYGGVMPLWSVLLGALFGRESFARAMGLMGPLTLPFTLVGLPFTTFVFERTGSYRPAFIGLLAFLSVSVVALAALRVPRR
jgi:MFS family permease